MTQSTPAADFQMGERFAFARPGWTLAAITAVALPYWRVRARLRILSHKDLGAIDEYVLRAIDCGVDTVDDVGAFLGLEDPLLRAVVARLVGGELIGWRGKNLALTRSGADVLRENSLTTPQVLNADVEWDGLLRRPVASLSRYLEPRNVRAAAVREIPPSPAAAPTAEEMRGHLPTIEAFLRQVMDRRSEKFDLLDIGGVERRFRIFRPATALVYERDGSRDIQVSIVIDGRVSDEHEQAFAKAGLPRRLGVGDRGLPTWRRGIERCTKAAGIAHARPLAPHEHGEPLRIALAHSSRRLVIIGRELRAAVVDDELVEQLTARLDAGVMVNLAWASRTREADGVDDKVLDTLRQLQALHPTLNLGTVSSGPGLLLTDDRFAVLTSYDYLGHRGGHTSNFHDQRGQLVNDGVDRIAQEVTPTIKPLADAPGRRSRRRSNGSRR